jgi:hypothetical protein
MRLVRFLLPAGATAAAAWLLLGRSRSRAAQRRPPERPEYGDGDARAARAEQAATVAPPEATGDERIVREPVTSGRFSLRGWAAAAGHAVVSGVTFRRRLAEDIRADQIEIEVDATENVPQSGLLVLRDGGFAPSREGFALMLAAAGPGAFSAAGSYRVYPRG